MTEPLIRLENLEKFYESRAGRTYVLRQISLDIQEGEFVTVMGPSGAGKSTLLHILGMLDGEWGGEYHFLDHAVHEMKVKHRNELHKQYIGFVFQAYHLLDNLTVYENLEIPLSYRNIKRSERQAMVGDIGTTKRREFTVLGDVVNMAARIKGNANPGQIVIAGSTARLLPETMKTTRIGMVQVRGRVAEAEVFRLLEE